MQEEQSIGDQVDGADDEEEEPEDDDPPGAEYPGKKKHKQEEERGCIDACKDACPCWVSFSKFLRDIVKKNEFERLIIILIGFNTVCMASEHYEQPEWLTKAQDIANLFFTVVFLIEMLMKLIALGFAEYASDGFNLFDAFIVIMSYVELCMPGNNSSLSVLRAFRLLRIFKIIKSWDSLRILLSTVLGSLTSITNLAVLILLYLFISSLLTK